VNTSEKKEEEDYPFFHFIFGGVHQRTPLISSSSFFASFLHEDNKEEKTRKRMFRGEHLQTRSEENQQKK
jgi:hypothetical protein